MAVLSVVLRDYLWPSCREVVVAAVLFFVVLSQSFFGLVPSVAPRGPLR